MMCIKYQLWSFCAWIDFYHIGCRAWLLQYRSGDGSLESEGEQIIFGNVELIFNKKGTSWHKSGTKRFSSAEKFNTPETVGPGTITIHVSMMLTATNERIV